MAHQYDEATDRYSGLWLPGDTGRAPITDATLIVKPAAAAAQRAEDVAGTTTSSAWLHVPDIITVATEGAPDSTATAATTAAKKPKSSTRYVGSAPINAERYSADFAKIATEILVNLAASGAKLNISLSIDAVHSEGFTEQQIRTIRENATTLKFTTNEFEAE